MIMVIIKVTHDGNVFFFFLEKNSGKLGDC